MSCFDSCINNKQANTNEDNVYQVELNAKNGGTLTRRRFKDRIKDYGCHPFSIEESISKTRSLKTLPIRKKTGDLYHHPDLPVLNMDEILKETLATKSDKNIATSHETESSIPPDVRMAWMPRNIFKSRKRMETTLSFTPILEIQCFENEDLGKKEN